MLLAIPAIQNLMPAGADIGFVYFYGDLDILVFTEQTTDSTECHATTVHVCKINKSLYDTNRMEKYGAEFLKNHSKLLALRSPTMTTEFNFTTKGRTSLSFLS